MVSGPLLGKRHTYAGWPDQALPDRAEATVVLAQRFFASHGPATLGDSAAWSSLTKTAAREAVAALPVQRARVGVEHLWLGEITHDD